MSRNERPAALLQDVVGWAICGAAALVGAWYGFQFGISVGGVIIGLVAAACSAAFCAVMASSVVHWLVRRSPPDRADG